MTFPGSQYKGCKEPCRLITMARGRTFALIVSFVSFAATLSAQLAAPAVTRLAVLKAEDRRAASASDLAVIRAGTQSGDPQTVRAAVRALGRLERPALVADILPFLKYSLPEIRSEAAAALGQALNGAKSGAAGTAASTVIDALAARLGVEDEAGVRSVIFESLGRT